MGYVLLGQREHAEYFCFDRELCLVEASSFLEILEHAICGRNYGVNRKLIFAIKVHANRSSQESSGSSKFGDEDFSGFL